MADNYDLNDNLKLTVWLSFGSLKRLLLKFLVCDKHYIGSCAEFVSFLKCVLMPYESVILLCRFETRKIVSYTNVEELLLIKWETHHRRTISLVLWLKMYFLRVASRV